jgi:hypothetical protein
MRLRSLLAAVCAVLLPAALPSTAARTPDQGIEVLAVRSMSDREVSLVAVLPPRSQRPTAVTALAGGDELPTRAESVLSDRTAVALVLDASANGASALRGGGLSGAANFLLQLPSGASTAVIADRRPPEVAAGISVGVSDDLRAMSSLRSGGEPATSDALTLAVQQLLPRPAQPVIVLYTTAPRVDGEPATAVAERLQRADAIVAVVNASADDAYWPTVATLTGGVAISARPGRSLDAFDAVADALRRRVTVTFRRPPAGIARVTLRVEMAGRPLLVDVDLPPAPIPPPSGRTVTGEQASGGVWLAAVLLLTAVIGSALLYRRRARGRDVSPTPPGLPSEPSSVADDEPGPSAEAGFRQPVRSFEELVEREPANPDHLRDLATAYQRLAGRDRADGRVALAAVGYRQAVDALAERVELEPGNAAFRHDLALAVMGLAELDAEQGWTAQAAAGYRRAIEIGEWLVQADPDNPEYRRDLDLTRSLAAALQDASGSPQD